MDILELFSIYTHKKLTNFECKEINIKKCVNKCVTIFKIYNIVIAVKIYQYSLQGNLTIL
jgi:hypothetical protein